MGFFYSVVPKLCIISVCKKKILAVEKTETKQKRAEKECFSYSQIDYGNENKIVDLFCIAEYFEEKNSEKSEWEWEKREPLTQIKSYGLTISSRKEKRERKKVRRSKNTHKNHNNQHSVKFSFCDATIPPGEPAKKGEKLKNLYLHFVIFAVPCFIYLLFHSVVSKWICVYFFSFVY